MNDNPLVSLFDYGQSFWYDNIRRKYLQDGTLQGLIDSDGLRGMTSNPSIFAKAIGGSDDYDEQLASLAADLSVDARYEALALADIQAACDHFTDLYQASKRTDGFVSLEVSPYLANDTEKTCAEAERLYAAVGRPNIMIKVPATPAGIPAIRYLIGRGINVNVTLMFSMVHYEAVAAAYLEGIKLWLAGGGDGASVASVASFFVSRVDTAVDKLLAAIPDPAAAQYQGKTAIANAKIVYQRYQALFTGQAFADLAAAGARPQRLLWASTSTKNPDFPDTIYVDELIGANTVNTMPPQTVDAFRDHGSLAARLTTDVAAASAVLTGLADVGVDLNSVTEKLQVDGVAAFAKSFDELLAAVARKSEALVT